MAVSSKKTRKNVSLVRKPGKVAGQGKYAMTLTVIFFILSLVYLGMAYWRYG